MAVAHHFSAGLSRPELYMIKNKYIVVISCEEYSLNHAFTANTSAPK
jgi:hypothetical protein